MDKLGKIPTPDVFVYQMLRVAGYDKNLIGKKFLENSCGDGNILSAVVEQYINISQSEGYNSIQIRQNLENDIFGFDIDDSAIINTIQRLDEITEKKGIKKVNWQIRKQDYLQTENKKYDFIIGNPPYITYHDLSDHQRLFIKENYSTCKHGRFDYSYAFIEKSLNSLKSEGILVYLVPYSIFRNKYASGLRSLLLNKIIRIIDYTGINVFPSRSIGTAIIVCKNRFEPKIIYTDRNGVERTINKNALTEKWYFSNSKEKNHIFGDYFNVSNSVATLRNEVYLFDPEFDDEKYYYLGDARIEKELAIKAVSPKCEKRNKKLVIIFPYNISNGKVTRIDEEIFQKKYPFTYQYLSRKKSLLDSRNITESIHWYEYGRSQAIKGIIKNKLIMPMIISNNISIYMEPDYSIPYAGYYITCKEDSPYSLDVAKKILESPDFLDYIKTHGTPTNKNSYRISVKEIINYSFDYS